MAVIQFRSGDRERGPTSFRAALTLRDADLVSPTVLRVGGYRFYSPGARSLERTWMFSAQRGR
jgi:hypothetical protein